MNDTQKEVSKEQEVQEPERLGKSTRSTSRTGSVSTKNGMKCKGTAGKGTSTSKKKSTDGTKSGRMEVGDEGFERRDKRQSKKGHDSNDSSHGKEKPNTTSS